MLRDAVETGIDPNSVLNSKLCFPNGPPPPWTPPYLPPEMTGGTNVGAGFIFSHDYYNANPVSDPDKEKRFEIVITDGFPTANSSGSGPADPRCPKAYKVNNSDGEKAYPFADDTVRCGVASELVDWKPDAESCVPALCLNWVNPIRQAECNAASVTCAAATFPGLRPDEVNAYQIMVYDPDPAHAPRFDHLRNIFNTYLGSDKYFESADANDLSSILEGIFSAIVESTVNVTIKREEP
jgi:hypothetical protein